MCTHFLQNKKGFTLIEMLVSVALFSIVLLIALGSIMTIVDVNRKSQTLTTVMNDLNFVLENMTRSIKTGNIDDNKFLYSNGDIDSLKVTDQNGREITYSFSGSEEGEHGYIIRTEDGEEVPITSDQIDIDELRFRVFFDSSNRQPRVLMVVRGTAAASQTISSEFTIQTTVSQRDLQTDNFNPTN